ncbi:MAG: zinc-dependent metalloprotease [Gemmataceae bacterium]
MEHNSRYAISLRCLSRRIVLVGMVIFLFVYPIKPVLAQKNDGPTSIKSFTSKMKKYPGLFPIYWDGEKGKLWMEIQTFGKEFLHVHSLPYGIGSNDIGLDRGQWGRSRVVFFQRVGPKVLLVEPNYQYRANTNNLAEREAVMQSFAKSILWGFQVEAEEKQRVLVDVTPFLLSDVHGVRTRLTQTKQGKYSPDLSRSAVHLPRTKNFPRNTEMEVVMTFTGNPEGQYIRSVTPTPEAVTVHQHHSFVALPAKGYRPRTFHPRSGYFSVQYKDYAVPLGEPMTKRYIVRHRLEKKNPKAKVSPPVKPIVYYLDRGAPEPVRSALLDGARWWNDAFELAGYKDAFQVKLLPEGADTMDMRYNVIQWVHRSTRGWSYGRTIHDPRTGEIIRGHVTLGSLRVRQDMVIAEGLLAPFSKDKKVSRAAMNMALARLRQLSAHEVGHTLGLVHNFAASTTKDASVMDYPHPKIRLVGNKTIDVSRAYGVGVGEWDKTAILYGYSDLRGQDEEKSLAKIVAEARKKGLVFITDQDARPASGAHPLAHLWDNGPNPTEELAHLTKVRSLALGRFGDKNIPKGYPLAKLEERLVPVYLLHRYQIEGVVKLVGGVRFQYDLRGDEGTPVKVVDPKKQTSAFLSLMAVLEPKSLALPDRLLELIPPRPPGYSNNRELFEKKTGPTLDPFAAAEGLADHTVGMILHPARCARLVEQKSRNANALGLAKVLKGLVARGWQPPLEGQTNYHSALARTVDNVVLYRIMALATSKQAPHQVKALAWSRLRALQNDLKSALVGRTVEDARTIAHYRYGVLQIQRFEQEPTKIPLPQPVSLPPGSPIGCCECWSCRGH